MKKINILRIIIFIILVLVVITAAIFIINKIVDRGGTKVSCTSDYPVNEGLTAYRQDDIRWKSDKIGNSSYTMEDSGCIISSIATAISESENALNPGELNDYLSKNNVFDLEGNLQWQTMNELPGFHVEVYSDVSAEIIDSCLADGHYPVIKVHRKVIGSYHHYVLIIGTEDGEYICMDPLEDNLTKLSDYKDKIYAIRCVWYQ